MADANTPYWNESGESVGKGVNALMGGWLIWLLLGGLFLFLMVRGVGCCGGHDNKGGHRGKGDEGGSGETGQDRKLSS